MKQILSIIGLLVLLAVIHGCDPGRKPNIAFKTGSNYVSSDFSATKQDTLTVGIVASKAEKTDVLKKFNVSVSYDGAATVSLSSEDLSGAQGDDYSKDIQVITRNVAGTEKYTFTVTNRDGLIGQVSLTLTVN